ncbi:MAG: hypothetical protein ACM3S1_10175 [Hyphomicrobiales bacterium]
MYVSPSVDDVLEGVIAALQTDVLPECTSEKSQLTVVMAQAVLTMLRQMVPVQQQYMAQEHNEMAATHRDIAAIIGDTPGPEADRIRERAEKYGSRPDFPAIPPFEAIAEGHRELTQGLVDTVRDLDTLIRAGNPKAEEALLRFRAAMGPRIARDFGTMVIGAGMAGRG